VRTTIDAAGRVVVPKALREELGFAPGAELEVTAVDGHLAVAVRGAPPRVRLDRSYTRPTSLAGTPA
jgi:AbrB family looped-hinge helix DNA binding protein